jgi:hypothetical protein
MTESKWTAGPWRVGRPLDLGSVEISTVVDDTLNLLCHVDINGPANARLIAAAPELYEALDAMVFAHEVIRPMNFDRARAALAKARGE